MIRDLRQRIIDNPLNQTRHGGSLWRLGIDRMPHVTARCSVNWRRGVPVSRGHDSIMPAERVFRAPVIDVFDRVLDKGIVFDASVRMSVGGIDLIAVESDVIVKSIDPDTYLNSVASRVVFIVAVDRPALFETMRVANSVSWTNVVLDRRRGERRRRTRGVATDCRHGERRTHDVDRALKSVGMAAVVLPQAPVTSIAARPRRPSS